MFYAIGSHLKDKQFPICYRHVINYYKVGCQLLYLQNMIQLHSIWTSLLRAPARASMQTSQYKQACVKNVFP